MGLLWSWKPWLLATAVGVVCGGGVAAYRIVRGFPCPHCRTRFQQYDWLLHHLEHDCGRLIKRKQDI